MSIDDFKTEFLKKIEKIDLIELKPDEYLIFHVERNLSNIKMDQYKTVLRELFKEKCERIMLSRNGVIEKIDVIKIETKTL